MAVTRATFLARFPEFTNTSTGAVDAAILDAVASCPPDLWKDSLDIGVSYLTAHLLASRQIQMGYQIGAAVQTAGGTGLATTLYGQEFQRLQLALPVSGFFV